MAVDSPVSQRLTVTALLLLTFATGLVDAVSVLVLGHVFVANMTGNVIFLGFWFVPHSGVDMLAAVVAFASFVAGAVLGGRLARHLGARVRRWETLRYGVILIMCSGAVLGATLTRWTVASVIASAAAVVAVSAAIFAFGPAGDGPSTPIAAGRTEVS